MKKSIVLFALLMLSAVLFAQKEQPKPIYNPVYYIKVPDWKTPLPTLQRGVPYVGDKEPAPMEDGSVEYHHYYLKNAPIVFDGKPGKFTRIIEDGYVKYTVRQIEVVKVRRGKLKKGFVEIYTEHYRGEIGLDEKTWDKHSPIRSYEMGGVNVYACRPVNLENHYPETKKDNARPLQLFINANYRSILGVGGSNILQFFGKDNETLEDIIRPFDLKVKKKKKKKVERVGLNQVIPNMYFEKSSGTAGSGDRIIIRSSNGGFGTTKGFVRFIDADKAEAGIITPYTRFYPLVSNYFIKGSYNGDSDGWTDNRIEVELPSFDNLIDASQVGRNKTMIAGNGLVQIFLPLPGRDTLNDSHWLTVTSTTPNASIPEITVNCSFQNNWDLGENNQPRAYRKFLTSLHCPDNRGFKIILNNSFDNDPHLEDYKRVIKAAVDHWNERLGYEVFVYNTTDPTNAKACPGVGEGLLFLAEVSATPQTVNYPGDFPSNCVGNASTITMSVNGTTTKERPTRCFTLHIPKEGQPTFGGPRKWCYTTPTLANGLYTYLSTDNCNENPNPIPTPMIQTGDLYKTYIHELGHAIGLDHINLPKTIAIDQSFGLPTGLLHPSGFVNLPYNKRTTLTNAGSECAVSTAQRHVLESSNIPWNDPTGQVKPLSYCLTSNYPNSEIRFCTYGSQTVSVLGDIAAAAALTTTPTATHQWQQQTTTGGAWTNVPNNMAFSGGNTHVLTMTRNKIGDQLSANFKVRCITNTPSCTVTSNEVPVRLATILTQPTLQNINAHCNDGVNLWLSPSMTTGTGGSWSVTGCANCITTNSGNQYLNYANFLAGSTTPVTRWLNYSISNECGIKKGARPITILPNCNATIFIDQIGNEGVNLVGTTLSHSVCRDPTAAVALQVGFIAPNMTGTCQLDLMNSSNTAVIAANIGSAAVSTAQHYSVLAIIPSSVPTGSYTIRAKIGGTLSQNIANLSISNGTYSNGKWTCIGIAGGGTQLPTTLRTDSLANQTIVVSDENTHEILAVTDLLTGVSLYPNPTQNYVMVEVPAYNGNTQLTIFDLQGRQHLTQTTTATQTRLDIAALPSGMYLVQIQQGAQRVTQKLVVQE